MVLCISKEEIDMLDLRKLYGKVTIEGEDFEYNQNTKQQEKIFLEYIKQKKHKLKMKRSME